MTELTKEEKQFLIELEEERERRIRENVLFRYKPYEKQKTFHAGRNAAGIHVVERILFAGTQSGKTYSASMEVAYHATGLYPDWWDGRRFEAHAPQIWVGGQSAGALRASAQQKLIGCETPFTTPHLQGTGSIPKDKLIKCTPSRGVPDSIDTMLVKHVSGETTTITFKTYEMHQNKWAGSTLDIIWLDEEPPMNIYIEALGRVTVRSGILFTTFTPLSGRTPLTDRFLAESSPDRLMVRMTLYEVGHKTKEQVDALLANYPEWEREARIFGLPAAGHGRIFTLMESAYVVDPVELRNYWPRIIGLDIGMVHPTAAVCLAHDVDTGRVYAYDEYGAGNLRVFEHAANLIMRGGGEFPIAWPHDANERDKGSNESVVAQYKKFGCNMLPTHAFNPEAGSSLWASVTDLNMRLTTGSLKVFSNCINLRLEIQNYHQKAGEIVKLHDDYLSALRYGVMMIKKAKVPDFLTPAQRAYRKSTGGVAKDANISPFAGLYGDRNG